MLLDISDYNSTVFNATFSAEETTTSLNISVYRDDIFESNETFDILLSLPPFLNLNIKVDNNDSAKAIIIDSTGKNNAPKFLTK